MLLKWINFILLWEPFPLTGLGNNIDNYISIEEYLYRKDKITVEYLKIRGKNLTKIDTNTYTVWQKWKFYKAHEDTHRWENISMQPLWQGIIRK